MRLIKMFFAAITIIPLVLVVSLQTAYACNCNIPLTATEALESSDAVFYGTVTSVKSKKLNGEKYTAVQLNVHESWKGITSTSITVYTPLSSCEYEFERGTDHLLYANQHEGELIVINCGRSGLIEHASADLSELQSQHSSIELQPTVDDSNQHFINWIIAIMFIFVLIIISWCRYHMKNQIDR